MMDPCHGWNTSVKPTIIGFIVSIVLILIAYFIVVDHTLAGWVLTGTLLGLASLQALFQLVFFLHICAESKPRWRLTFFLFLVLVMVVLVGGSLWIMHNLNYDVMPVLTY